jgi:PAS domain S-box-containing protein
MTLLQKRPANPVGMIAVVLVSFFCLMGLFQYSSYETKKLQDKKNEAQNLIDAWKHIESTTKDLMIAEDLVDARTRWKAAINSFDSLLARFIRSEVIRDIKRQDAAFEEKIKEIDNLWRIMKPRIEYVQPRLDEYLDNQNMESKRSLLYELLFQVEQSTPRQDYMTLFDLTFDIKYMVSSLSTYFVSVLNSSVASISSAIDRKAVRVRYVVFVLSLVLVIITIVFITLTQKYLRESRERFRQVVELSPFPTCVVDPLSRIEYINKKFVDVFGYTREEIPTIRDWGLKAFTLLEDRRESAAFWNEGLSKKQGADGSSCCLPVQCKDGSLRQIIFRQVEMVDKKRFLICEDITERKRAEEALRASERKFRAIFDQTFQFIGLLDTSGAVLEINRTALDYIRAGEADILGKFFWETPWWSHSSSEQEKLRGAIASAAAGGFARFETTNISSDGTLVNLDVSIKPVRDEGGRVIMLLPEGRDITERKKAEQERAQLISAIEQASETVMVLGRDGVILYANPAVERIMGYAVSELIGRKAYSFAGAPDPTQPFEQIWDRINKGLVWSGRVTQKKKDGTAGELEITVSPVRDSAGAITSFVSIGRDITSELRIEEQLRQAQKMEAIGTLAGGIAHDFNNILAAIMGYTEMSLIALRSKGDVSNNLAQILKSSNRAKDLVKQILAFSRKQQKERKPVNLYSIIQEVTRLLRASIPTTIEIRQDVQDVSCMVDADPTQIHQVLMNLAANASQSMEENGGVLAIGIAPVVLSAQDAEHYPDLLPGQYVRFTVSDTGSGIDPLIIHRVFDPFYTTKAVGRGTGMGLSVAHGIIKDHGGSITVYSEPGQGTTFHVLLPRIANGSTEDSETEKKTPGGIEKILFVDDEDVLVDLGHRMLTGLGYTVISRHSSLEALEAFKAAPHTFDAVITDQTMPNMTGFELAQELMRLRPDIPVILCTGFSERVSEEKARDAGIKAFIMKPVNIRELGETIRKVLDS